MCIFIDHFKNCRKNVAVCQNILISAPQKNISQQSAPMIFNEFFFSHSHKASNMKCTRKYVRLIFFFWYADTFCCQSYFGAAAKLGVHMKYCNFSVHLMAKIEKTK